MNEHPREVAAQAADPNPEPPRQVGGQPTVATYSEEEKHGVRMVPKTDLTPVIEDSPASFTRVQAKRMYVGEGYLLHLLREAGHNIPADAKASIPSVCVVWTDRRQAYPEEIASPGQAFAARHPERVTRREAD